MMNKNDVTWSYHLRRPNGIPENFPKGNEVFVLIDKLPAEGGSYHRLIEIGGVRYVLRLDFNKDENDCLENVVLRDMYEAVRLLDRSRMHKALGKVMNPFWSYLHDNFEMRRENRTLMKPIGPLDFDRSESHKLQIKTVDGTVHAVEHDTDLDNRDGAVEIPCTGVPCFSKSEVEILEKLTNVVYKVKVQGKQYCLKIVRWKSSFREESRKLRKVDHPNVVQLRGFVQLSEGAVVGFLMPFIPGALLGEMKSATDSQKATWKESISRTIAYLHANGLVWGDAKPHNIMINSATDAPILIDFEGGSDDKYVDRDLCNTQEGDLQALERILAYIDEL